MPKKKPTKKKTKTFHVFANVSGIAEADVNFTVEAKDSEEAYELAQEQASSAERDYVSFISIDHVEIRDVSED
jgi:hypothetical protein